MEKWSLSFASQTTFQPFGHLICTPISILAASSYLKIPSNFEISNKSINCYPLRNRMQRNNLNLSCFHQIQACFTPAHVNQMMFASHMLYKDFFSSKGLQLMIQDIYPWIPQNSYDILEAAGLILSPHSNTADGHIIKTDQCSISTEEANKTAEEIILMTLLDLLQNFCALSEERSSKVSIIVTAKNHTVCFMCSENGSLFVFDPLPALVSFIPQSRLRESLALRYGISETVAMNHMDVEYSAIVMKNMERT